MARATLPSPKTKRLTVSVVCSGQNLTFKLHTRPLQLGAHATIQYYWMDSSQLRTVSSEAAAANYRNCLTHWWRSIQARLLHHDLDQQIHYVMAQTYPLVCRCKSLQTVFRDAFLDRQRSKEPMVSLPAEDGERINNIVLHRDRFQVKEELDYVLGRLPSPAEVLPALRQAFRTWAGRGVILWRQHGPEGLSQFLHEVAYWLARYRKKGGHRWVRHFINLFAYEAKVSFNTCFANAWVDIIPALQVHHGLDVVSERFLRFWHHQNQPVELPHGRTAGGIYYPTHIHYDFFVASPDGRAFPRRLCVPTQRIGSTHVPDVFSGQVLSLHPLSGFFMQDRALCAVAGKFFAAERYEEILANGLAEYWDFVGAILTAAHLYRRAADEQTNSRGVRRRGGNAVNTAVASTTADSASEALLFEDFAVDRKFTCPDCRGPVRFVRFYPAESGGHVRVDYLCPCCQKPIAADFPSMALVDWLKPAN